MRHILIVVCETQDGLPVASIPCKPSEAASNWFERLHTGRSSTPMSDDRDDVAVPDFISFGSGVTFSAVAEVS